MALNAPVIDFAGGRLPVAFSGETLLVQRDHIELSLAGGLPRELAARGRLFLTTHRLCFIPDRLLPGLTAIDIPLQVRM